MPEALKPICRVEYHDDVTRWTGGQSRSVPPEIWFRAKGEAAALRKVLVERGYRYGWLLQIPATQTKKIKAEIAFLRPLTRLRFSTGAGLRYGNEKERSKAAAEQEEIDARWAVWEKEQQRKHMLQAAHREAVRVAEALFESYLDPDDLKRDRERHREWSERYKRLNKTLGDSTAPFLRKVLRVATGRGGWSSVKSDDLMDAADAIVTGPDTSEKQRLLAACGRDDARIR